MPGGPKLANGLVTPRVNVRVLMDPFEGRHIISLGVRVYFAAINVRYRCLFSGVEGKPRSTKKGLRFYIGDPTDTSMGYHYFISHTSSCFSGNVLFLCLGGSGYCPTFVPCVWSRLLLCLVST